MLNTPLELQEQEAENIAIAKAIAASAYWATRFTPIEAIAIPTRNAHGKTERIVTIPAHYVCRRCNKPGHHVTKCVTNGDPAFDKPQPRRVAAGIPKSFIQVLTAEGMCRADLTDKLVTYSIEAEKDKNAVIAHDGTYGTVIPRSAQFSKYSDSVKAAERSRIPTHLTCGLCHHLIKKPIQFPCCCTLAFCSECIMPSYEFEGNTVDCVICKRYYSSPHLTCLISSLYLYLLTFSESVLQRILSQQVC